MESNEYLYKADLRKSLTQLVFEADLAKKQTEELIKNGQAITQPELDETNARISEIIAHNGDGTKDTEVIDARKGQTTLRDKINLIDSDIDKNAKDFAEYKEKIILSKNLLNLNDENFEIGYFVNTNTGKINATPGYCASGFIEVVPLETYSLTRTKNWSAWYDKNLAFIVGDNLNSKITAPTNAKYLRITLIDGSYATSQVEKGAIKTPFEPYAEVFKIKKDKVDGLDKIESDVDALKNKESIGEVLFSKVGDILQVRTKWDDVEDLAHRMKSNGSANGGLNLTTIVTMDKNSSNDDVISGTTFKDCSDDVTPIRMIYTNVGGNHGWETAYKITCQHGKTLKDIGSIWQKNNGTQYTITTIIDTNNLIVISKGGSSLYPINVSTPVSPLTHVSGATNVDDIVFSKVAGTQLYPSINHKSFKVLLNGEKEFDLSKNNYDYCDFVDVCEGYDIYDIREALDYIEANVPNNNNNSIASDNLAKKYCRVSFIYRFTKNGACTVYANYDFYQQVLYNWNHIVQSMPIGSKLYIPNTTNYNMVKTQTETNTKIDPTMWENTTKPPYRYYQFSDDMGKGFSLGFSNEFASAIPEVRLPHLESAYWLYSSKKMYPFLFQHEQQITTPKDFHIETVAFRIPLKQHDADLTQLSWYWVGNDIYLMLDTHKNINKYIKLPNYMIGKKITSIDVNANTTINQFFISTDGLKVKVINDYGYAVLKLS